MGVPGLVLGGRKVLARGLATAAAGWLELHGMYGSPYTRKVQAALRYKQVAFTQHQLMPGDVHGDWADLGFGGMKPKVIPVVRYQAGEVQNDSTFILESLDQRFPARPLAPSDPAVAFYSLLLEDMFDEWGTKVMFGLRWLEQEDQDWTGRWLIYDTMLGRGVPLEQCAVMGRQFGARQVDRMAVVGCRDPELVRRSAAALLGALERHLAPGNLCLLGVLPCAADFALYGQLSQLVVDRGSDRLLRDSFPASWAWVRRMEDLSGPPPAHHADSAFLEEMLGLAGQVYLPFLAANRAALAAGEAEVRVTLWPGEAEPLEHTQPVFRYQEKCLVRIQTALAALPPSAAGPVHSALGAAGCLPFLRP